MGQRYGCRGLQWPLILAWFVRQASFWLVFPTAETAKAAVCFGRRTTITFCAHETSAVTWARTWSDQLKCSVTFLTPDDVIMVVEIVGEGLQRQIRVIDCDGNFGWINITLYTDDQLDSMFRPIGQTTIG